jgi:molecular chaperone DnaK (HSP70)
MRSIDKCCIPFADVFSTQLAPLTLGIEMVGGVMAKLIPRTCIIPAKKSQVFTTYQDEQTFMSLQVWFLFVVYLVFQHMKFEHLL